MWKTKLRKSSKGCFSEIAMLLAQADGTHRGAMSTIWEKIGFGVLWTVIGAAAVAVGGSVYFTEQHKGDIREIDYLRGRVHDLEDKNDQLRKEAGESKVSAQTVSELAACQAKVDEIRRIQNAVAVQEIRRLEAAVDADERRVANLDTVLWSGAKPVTDAESTADRVVKERLTSERADLSAMRQKLVCVP